jgi:hypothetical protein
MDSYNKDIFVEDFKVPRFDKDDCPSNDKDQKVKKENDNNDDDDESYPLLQETDLGGTPVAKALKRQCR